VSCPYQKVADGRTTRESRFSCTTPTKLHYSIIIGQSQSSSHSREPPSSSKADQLRLKVPKIRSSLEYLNFVILFILYVVAMEGLEQDRLNARELVFIIYALGASLLVASQARRRNDD
jgi:hypothetical protein